MFNVLRCPKCDHYIIGQDEFVKTITERMNRNIVKLRKADKIERQAILQENSMYATYLKYVLDIQYRLKKAELKDTAFLKELLAYCREYELLNKETLDELRRAAYRKQQRQAKNIAKELERVYGDKGNCFCNKSMPDPTAKKAMKNVMKREWNYCKHRDEEMDPIYTCLPYGPKFS